MHALDKVLGQVGKDLVDVVVLLHRRAEKLELDLGGAEEEQRKEEG